MATSVRTSIGPFGAYYHRDVPEPDSELTRFGPGTPGGEYLRRFWQPVGLSADIQDLPKAVRIMGEDLVLFRDGAGNLGLLAQHCSHRGTSLEYATVEGRGLRCCYHGWLYAPDGRILDTPGEPEESALKERFFHGAYPTFEYKGMIFGYMGPPESKPAFPILDTFEMPGYHLVAQWGVPTPCNWMQMAENNVDPVHLVYLHRFEEIRGRLDPFRPSVDPERTLEDYIGAGLAQWKQDVEDIRADTNRHHLFEWQLTPFGISYAWTRRIGELVWVRLSDYILPNIDQIPRSLQVADESQELLFDPPRTTSWTIPVDDEHTMTCGFQHVLDGAPRGSRYQFTGATVPKRSYEDRQRQPGDYEALATQRTTAVHALEHLGWSDTGVIMVRKLIRDGVRSVARGGSPTQPSASDSGVIPTTARSTILRVPPAATPEADRDLLRATVRRVLAGEFPKPAAVAAAR